MQRRYTNKRASNIGAFFKRNLIFIVILILLAIYLVPLVVTKIQDFLAELKANKKDNETKLIVNNTKNEVVQNSNENTNISTTDLEKKFLLVKNKFRNSKGISFNTWQSLKSDAENLALALGTHAKNNQAWFGLDGILSDRPDLNSLTEDEKEAIRILKKYPKTFPILAELYYKMFTRSRNLKSDIIQYIPKNDVAILRKHYKNYKQSWL